MALLQPRGERCERVGGGSVWYLLQLADDEWSVRKAGAVQELARWSEERKAAETSG